MTTEIMIQTRDENTARWRVLFPVPITASSARALLADKNDDQFRAVDWHTRESIDIWTPERVH